jgi:hypothetical protein
MRWIVAVHARHILISVAVAGNGGVVMANRARMDERQSKRCNRLRKCLQMQCTTVLTITHLRQSTTKFWQICHFCSWNCEPVAFCDVRALRYGSLFIVMLQGFIFFTCRPCSPHSPRSVIVPTIHLTFKEEKKKLIKVMSFYVMILSGITIAYG